MEKMIQAGIRILGPVVLHFFAINIVLMMGLHVDAAFRATMAAILVLPIYLWLMKKDGYEQQRQSKFLPGNAIMTVILALVMNVALTGVTEALAQIAALSGNADFLAESAQDALFASSFPILLLGVGIITPITEEVLFRGLVYNRLRDYNKGWLSIILAAGMFAVYHGDIRQALAAFPMAVVMIVLYDRWDCFLAPVLFHMTVNLSSILIAAVWT